MLEPFESNTIKHYKKGTILLAQGDRCLYAYKVKKGCLKSYVLDKAGKEHILQFSPEGWIVSDMNSFVYDVPATLFIDAIEDSELVVFDRNFVNATQEQTKEKLIQVIKIFTNNIIATQKRLMSLLSATAEDRYFDFVQTYPTLVQRLPLKLIASYIGITPEYLSEIRKKITKK